MNTGFYIDHVYVVLTFIIKLNAHNCASNNYLPWHSIWKRWQVKSLENFNTLNSCLKPQEAWFTNTVICTRLELNRDGVNSFQVFNSQKDVHVDSQSFTYTRLMSLHNFNFTPFTNFDPFLTRRDLDSTWFQCKSSTV